MIFARSRRMPVAVAGLGGLAAILMFVAIAGEAAARHFNSDMAVTLVAAIMAAVLAGWAATKLRNWPSCRLGIFRDRLVVIQGHQQVHAAWSQIETATLADQELLGWEEGWPEVRLGNRLTIRIRGLRGGARRTVVFMPAEFGLDPAGCRDMLLRLRDEPALRSRFPEFDSALDLNGRRIVVGEAMAPRL